MSIFGNILSKIFHHGEAQAAPSGGTAAPAPPQPTQAPSSTSAPPPPSAPQPTTQPPMGGAAAPAQQVDVGKVLSDMAAKNPEKLDWKHSIVDLLKLLGMDSSLTARKALADELHYTGDKNDSATMNIWLSKQVMAKLAANGGKLPDDLKS